jgi:hypothetical protein
MGELHSRPKQVVDEGDIAADVGQGTRRGRVGLELPFVVQTRNQIENITITTTTTPGTARPETWYSEI